MIYKTFWLFQKNSYFCILYSNGKLPEWSIGPHSKCGVRVTVPGVRIPRFPLKKLIIK